MRNGFEANRYAYSRKFLGREGGEWGEGRRGRGAKGREWRRREKAKWRRYGDLNSHEKREIKKAKSRCKSGDRMLPAAATWTHRTALLFTPEQCCLCRDVIKLWINFLLRCSTQSFPPFSNTLVSFFEPCFPLPPSLLFPLSFCSSLLLALSSYSIV